MARQAPARHGVLAPCMPCLKHQLCGDETLYFITLRLAACGGSSPALALPCRLKGEILSGFKEGRKGVGESGGGVLCE